MNKKIIILTLTAASLLTGFLVAGQPQQTARDKILSLHKGDNISQLLKINNEGLTGVSLLINPMDKQAKVIFEITKDKETLVRKNFDVYNSSARYQTHVFRFKPVQKKGKLSVNINVTEGLLPVYYNSKNVYEDGALFLNSKKINGVLFFKTIYRPDIKNVFLNFKERFFANKKFAFFYIILISIILISLGIALLKSKKETES